MVAMNAPPPHDPEARPGAVDGDDDDSAPAPQWLSPHERATWVRLTAVLELLPGVLDSQLRRDVGLTYFEYYLLAMLSEAPERTLRMAALARHTNATLPRLSHVVRRLENRGLVERFPCPEDGRATNARLTAAGWDTVVAAAPGHVSTVRRHVLDPLTAEQVEQLGVIGEALLTKLDPEGRMRAVDDPSPVASRDG
jgi:DNA-binding MarR family transcriptional regulator